MRIISFFLFVASLAVSARPAAQTITLSGKDLPLEKVFTSIQKQTGFGVIGNYTLLAIANPVSFSVRDMPLEEFLNLIFHEQPLSFRVEDKTIFLSRKPLARFPVVSSDQLVIASLLPISGVVRDPEGNPLVGATVQVKGKRIFTVTDNEGRFTLAADVGDLLEVSYVGFEKKEFKVKNANAVELKLERLEADLDDVEVVINTGYQKLKPNEMAGAVDIISKKMLMEQTGSTIMERLVGMSGSLNFNNKVMPGNSGSNPNSVLNMTIRGYSTISGTTDPLIIVNNFPYTGNIDNIDPNNVESIVILKDAAATAMWGIRAANGVIVITTSGSKFKQKTTINFTSTATLTEKPNLNKVDVASGPEVYDFLAEYRGKSMRSSLSFLPGVPELDFLGWQYYNKKSITKEVFDAKLNAMKALDPKKQWSDLLYRNGNAQTYSLNIAGGSESLAWTISGSFNKSSDVLQAKANRSNVNMNTTYKLNDKLSLDLGITYTSSFSKTGAPAYNSFKDGGRYMVTRPLANADGTPYGWWTSFSPIFMDTAASGLFGDLKFYPLENWKHDFQKTELTNYVKNFGIRYSPLKDLDISAAFQSIDESVVATTVLDNDSYFTRYNQAIYSEINRNTNFITRHLPAGEFRKIRNRDANSYNVRMNMNYKRAIHKGILLFNGAIDLSESKNFSDGQFLAGYKDIPRSYMYMPDNISMYSSLRGGETSSSLLGIKEAINISETTQRNISTTGSLSYIYDERFIINANVRRDGANILGVNVNDRWKPNYSLALNWKIHEEKFFKIPFVSNLTAGLSFGYIGSVDVSKSSRIVVLNQQFYSGHTDLTEYDIVEIPPNPELRWEKTAHTNFKFDIGLLNDRIQIRTNYFIKNVRDLYMDTEVDPLQSLAYRYVANAGTMQVKGYEIVIEAKIIKSPINYDITLTTANTKEKITYYPNGNTYGYNLIYSLANDGVSLGATPFLFKDMPLYSIYSLGGHQGVNNEGRYFIDHKGKKYTSYNDLQVELNENGTDMEGVKYYGTGTPKFTGAMHHRINYKRFSFVLSLQAELGHYFKYPKDQIGALSLSSQFERSWKKPGDELHTNIPSYSYPIDPSWQTYNNYADVNIFKGGVIRISNIHLNYSIPTKKLKNLKLGINIQDLGKIWTANKEGYDYRHLNYMIYKGQNKYYAFSLNVGL